jgi:hypothetical protein
MPNVFDALNDEIERVTEVRRVYAELPGNCGMPAIMVSIDPALSAAKKARSEMDAVGMIRALQSLKEIEQ